jgi:opacity protein-like surface antigen
MNVTGAVLILATVRWDTVAFSQAHDQAAPRFELYGGYSVNTDSVRNVPAIFVVDQKASPFFSHGSGPAGFEFSVKRYLHDGLGIKADLSGYSDSFPSGRATYCQPSGCAANLTFQASGRALYLTVGPEWRILRDKRFSPFAQVLVGAVHANSKFTMSGPGGLVPTTGSALPFTGGVLLYRSAGLPAAQNLMYSDFNSDNGLALSLGGGVDIRLRKRLAFRASMDYDPTFLVRPVTPDYSSGQIALTGPIPSERNRQDHVRLTMGIVWRFH